MQEQIEELEYIKSNLSHSSNGSLLSNEVDENTMDSGGPADLRRDYDALRRKSVLFLHEAHRLANERRAGLARTAAIDETRSKRTNYESSLSSPDSDDNEADQTAFNFDHRSEDDEEVVNLTEVTPGLCSKSLILSISDRISRAGCFCRSTTTTHSTRSFSTSHISSIHLYQHT